MGVLIRDALVEERLFVDATPVTIGQSLRCRLSIPVDGMPHEHVLFASAQGRIVLARIQGSYMAGLQRCYKQGLVGDASLGGKVAVSFSVDETGRVDEPAARGLTAEVDRCIAGQMATWRFPAPRDTDGDPSDAAFALALALTPG